MHIISKHLIVQYQVVPIANIVKKNCLDNLVLAFKNEEYILHHISNKPPQILFKCHICKLPIVINTHR